MEAYNKFHDDIMIQSRFLIETVHVLQEDAENEHLVNLLSGPIAYYSNILVHFDEGLDKEIAETRRKIATHEAAVARLELRAKHMRATNAALKRELRAQLRARKETATKKRKMKKKWKKRFNTEAGGVRMRFNNRDITVNLSGPNLLYLRNQ